MTNFKTIIESSQRDIRDQACNCRLQCDCNQESWTMLYFFNFSLFIRKLLGKFQKDRLYGVFADVTLVEKEQCTLTPNTCSKFEPFLSLPAYPSQNHVRRSYDDSYRRQGETNFSFIRRTPICRRTCFRF